MYEDRRCQNSYCYRMAFYQIGVAYHLLFQLTEADYFIQKAYELDPEDPTFVGGRGFHYFLQKKYEEAEIYFLRVINSKSENADLLIEQQTAYKTLSRICQIKKNYKLQIYYIEQIINIEPRRYGFFIQIFEQIILDEQINKQTIFYPEQQLSFDDKIQLIQEIEKSEIFYDFAIHLLQLLTFFEINLENKEKSFEYYNRLIQNHEYQNKNNFEDDSKQNDKIDYINSKLTSQDEFNMNIIENLLTKEEIKDIKYSGDKQKAFKNKLQKRWEHRNMEEYDNNINDQSKKYEGYITEFQQYNKKYVVCFDKNLQLNSKIRAKFISASEKGFIKKKNYSGIKKIKNNNNTIQYKIKIAKSDYRLWCSKERLEQEIHILNFDELLSHQKQKNKYQN